MTQQNNNVESLSSQTDADKNLILLRRENAQLRQNIEALEQQLKDEKKTVRKHASEESLKPYQSELIKLQNYLGETKRRLIILFEGRDTSGKGGTIRRVSRYMNEKHYRIVALARPSANQRTQWFFQRYVEHFPRGGEVVLFDRSWYNRAIVEPIFGFCTPEEYNVFMRGVSGFEKDLVRHGTTLIKLYFSVTQEE